MVRKYDTLYFEGETGERTILLDPDVAMIRLEIKGGSLTAVGYLSKDSDPQPLSGISAKDYSVNATMSTGIHTIECSGLYSVVTTYQGNSEVVFKTIV